MADFGESADLELLFDRHDEDCYFCNKKEVIEALVNDPDADFDEDSQDVVGLVANGKAIKHQNDSGKLGTSCRDTDPGEKWILGDEFHVELPVVSAAHHLIPGDASLKKSKLFKDAKNGIQAKGKAEGNVGYDVNNTVNGVWLPGSYAFSSSEMKLWGKGGRKFEELFAVTPYDYAAGAIEFSGAQFHDSHPQYSSEVVKVLDEIHNKLKKMENVPWCPEVAKKEGKLPPRYAIVNRLASVSLRLRRLLTFPTTAWKKDMYTSKHSLQWMEDQKRNRKKPRGT